MKLLLDATLDPGTIRCITDALFRIDLGARVNFDLAARMVRIEGRMTLAQATAALERGRVPVAAVVDSRIVDATRAYEPGRGQRHAQAA